jgi:hypothetical protein
MTATPGGMNSLAPQLDPYNNGPQNVYGSGGAVPVSFADWFGMGDSSSSSDSSGGPTVLGTIQIAVIGIGIIVGLWFAKDIFDKVT